MTEILVGSVITRFLLERAETSLQPRVFAMSCLRNGVVYNGIVWSEDHKKLLEERLNYALWQEYLNAESPLYQLELQLGYYLNFCFGSHTTLA